VKNIKKIVILGAGGNARDIMDTIHDINSHQGSTFECVGFLDDDKTLWGRKFIGEEVLGPIEKANDFIDCFFVNGVYSVIEFFNNEEVIKKAKIPLSKYITIIHPSSHISQTAKIDKGSVVLRNVTIMSDVIVGKHVNIHPGAVISHDTEIGDYSFIANTASIGGYVKIGNSCFIGANSSLRDRITIGNYSIIGIGSAVVEDVSGEGIYIGSPARFLRKSR